MKGSVGTSTTLIKMGKVAKKYYRKQCNRARRRIEQMGKGALRGGTVKGVVVIPPVQNLDRKT